MRYFQLRAFDAVARERSFSQAARSLGLTQPAVTMQVRNLEAACGQTLFDRTGATVELTPSARALFELTRQMFAVEELAEDYVSEASSLRGGDFKLAGDGPHVALLLLSAYRKAHPGINITMSFGSQRDAWDEVIGGHSDAAILGNAPKYVRVMKVPVVTQGMMALLPRGHPLATRRLLRLADLAGHAVIRREPGSNTQRLLDKALRRAKLLLPTALELGSREAVQEAVKLGIGIGFLLEREHSTDAGTVTVPLDELCACNIDSVVCLHRQRKRRIIKPLLEIATAIGWRETQNAGNKKR
jgi:DNA-binding transcriptional LysR family regulator